MIHNELQRRAMWLVSCPEASQLFSNVLTLCFLLAWEFCSSLRILAPCWDWFILDSSVQIPSLTSCFENYRLHNSRVLMQFWFTSWEGKQGSPASGAPPGICRHCQFLFYSIFCRKDMAHHCFQSIVADSLPLPFSGACSPSRFQIHLTLAPARIPLRHYVPLL